MSQNAVKVKGEMGRKKNVNSFFGIRIGNILPLL